MDKKKFIKNYMSWVVCLGQSMHYVQAYKIFVTKSAEDISLISYLIGLVLLAHWLIYGILAKDKVIILAETLGTIGVLLIIVGTYLYS